MDDLKTCFKCGIPKPRSEFYAHKRMADGLLGKCKACTKSDTAANSAHKMATNPIYQIVEGARQRAKAERRRKEGKASPVKPDTVKAWRKRNPEKVRCHNAVARAIRAGKLVRGPCEECGTTDNVHAHHDDYSKPLEVRWLCAPCHGYTHTDF
jgi:hypothetical protein